MMKYMVGWESNGKKHPYYGKIMITNFPGSPHMKGFVAFSHTVGNWWENSSFSQMMKYAVGWKSNGQKAPILWENYEYQFPRLSPYGFVGFSHTVVNWWGNSCISQMMKYAIGWESNGKKAPILREKYEYQFPRISPYYGFCCIFP